MVTETTVQCRYEFEGLERCLRTQQNLRTKIGRTKGSAVLEFRTDTNTQDSRCSNRVPADGGGVSDAHGGQAIIHIAFLSNLCSLAYLSPGMDQRQPGWAYKLHHSPPLQFCQTFRWFVHLNVTTCNDHSCSVLGSFIQFSDWVQAICGFLGGLLPLGVYLGTSKSTDAKLPPAMVFLFALVGGLDFFWASEPFKTFVCLHRVLSHVIASHFLDTDICRYLFFLLTSLICLDYHSNFMRGTDQFQPSMPHMAEEFQVSKSSAFGSQKKRTFQVALQLMTGLNIL